MQSTVAAMILCFVYRCGGSVGIARRFNLGAPSSRLIPGLGSLQDTYKRADRVCQIFAAVNLRTEMLAEPRPGLSFRNTP